MKRDLLDRAESVCPHLLPAGKRIGSDWVCGGIDGRPGRSLSINLTKGFWKDFATLEAGSNLLELWRQVRRTDFATALLEAAAFCGQTVGRPARKYKAADKAGLRALWPAFEIGTPQDFIALARLRGIAIGGLELASQRGLLRFAAWRGYRCWIVTDSRRLNAQARRMDGQPFKIGDSKSTKALSLPGSLGALPIGLNETKEYHIVAVVEGGPDLLAAHGYMCAEGREDVAGVALLGASNHPPATVWVPLAGKRVRAYCHRDDAGMAAGQAWGKAILDAGAAHIDGFRFDGLRKIDDSPVTDLNDLLEIHPTDFENRRDVWEILP